MRCLPLVALLALFGAACGDNDHPPPPNFVETLRALPGVADARELSTNTAGYHYYVLHFRQPVDHDAPGGATFLQEVSLLHKELAAPLIVHTSGYWDYYLDSPVELTRLLGANQISIEHRYFGTSRPEPADWTKLTIAQMAADEHAIVSALRTVYTGAAISTGGSKGGMTAIFYRRFYPDDVDGTVPYVAPISFGAPDPRYVPFLQMIGPAACHAAVQAAAVEMLENRRAALEALASAQAQQKGYSYTRVLLGPAVESAIVGLEWSFWQYYGVNECENVPATTASDTQMFQFLDLISPISDSDDDQIAAFEAYYYQAYFQLGYPADGTDAYLKAYEKYSDADYAKSLPTVQPAYDGGTAMHDIDGFVEQMGDRFVFVYGQWDPWTGGAFTLGSAADSLELVQAMGTHDSRLTQLASGDQDAAFAKLASWTGVRPSLSGRVVPELRTPHVPPAMVRALRARRVLE